jgi:hypothetical protein
VGAGSHLSRALIRRAGRTGAVAVVAAAFAACIDFVDPNIPDAGGPAVISATSVISERGTIDVRAVLNPGLDLAGIRRIVPDPGLAVNDTVIAPDRIQRDGDRIYQSLFAFDVATGRVAVRFLAPPVPGIAAPPPTAHLVGIRRMGPDTLRIASGSDLLIRLAREPGTSEPEPLSRQWFLTLAADTAEFRLGGNGPPPDTILVPARFIPAGDSLEVRLIYQQLAEAQAPPGDYVGVFTLDTRLFWTVRVDAGGRP